MAASKRGWGAVWALIGGAMLAGAVWYLKHVSPVLPASDQHESHSDSDGFDLQKFLEILPWAGILVGTFAAYHGLIMLAFGAGADVVEKDDDKTKVHRILYWIGFVAVLAGVVLAGIFVLKLKLLSLNRDDYR
ncbi:MAG: hypothetical protein IPQ07_37115 [Myxococcales bacterium]|nr:hypothetical protein [Myxococcales bacterium]